MDSLLSEGVHHGALAALTSASLHYGGVNFDVVGQGCTPRSKDDVLAIVSAAAQGEEVLASKKLVASVRLQW